MAVDLVVFPGFRILRAAELGDEALALQLAQGRADLAAGGRVEDVEQGLQRQGVVVRRFRRELGALAEILVDGIAQVPAGRFGGGLTQRRQDAKVFFFIFPSLRLCVLA